MACSESGVRDSTNLTNATVLGIKKTLVPPFAMDSPSPLTYLACMNWLTNRPFRPALALLASLTLITTAALASDPTAFELVKEGNRYIGEQSKDRVVQIRSDKSIGGLVPKVWYIVYYDETAKLKAVEVKMVGGKMTAVTRPLRLLEAATSRHEELDPKRLKVDSDKALGIALKESILENLKISSTMLRLDHGDTGPIWKIRLWAEKLKNPLKTVEIGEIVLDAETGKISKLDVHIEKVQ
jgi:hypothetical protein